MGVGAAILYCRTIVDDLSAFAAHQFVEPAADVPVQSRTAQMRKPVQAVFTRGQ
jgi:hypothetical protein